MKQLPMEQAAEEKPAVRPKRTTRPPARLIAEEEPKHEDAAKAPRTRKRKVLPAGTAQ